MMKLIETYYNYQGDSNSVLPLQEHLLADSPVILADEPTGNLDSDTADEIIEILKTSAHKHGKVCNSGYT